MGGARDVRLKKMMKQGIGGRAMPLFIPANKGRLHFLSIFFLEADLRNAAEWHA